ncbi:cytochrome P450 [Streptomyces sp. VRA16 Mangrove soil]|uniref:cytochrome P450 n=1 Tax=Streptomyces sp. VRA16 Mangrove soil TaxID=2817434 RepID=UPI001A9EF40F|nr:cytochrome P450 [Streptomyces sp. VRA16 Mangrove soil]MBO1335505.1 cytochrome P450 [Streptomyces sp. VRA16 Mangrove soil]
MLCPLGPVVRAESVAPRGSWTPPSLAEPDVARDPYPLYRMLRDRHPLLHDEPFGAWLLSRHADVRAALADPRLVAPPPGRTFAHLEQGMHAAQRALVSPALQGRALAALKAGVERSAYVLARRLTRREEVDLVEEFCRWLPTAAVVAALGLPHDETVRVTAWSRTELTHLGAAPADVEAALHPHVTRRRAHPGTDLLSVLCTARPGGRPLPDEAVVGIVATLLGAGGEATGRALAGFLANLLDHPAQLALVRARPDLTDAAWAESLRRDPAVHLVRRRALAPVATSGGTIPAGATVACLVGSAGRDAARFTDPDRYDLFRTDPGQLAFGTGRHRCLGVPLARMIAGTGLRALLEALPALAWAPGFRPVPEGLDARAPATLLVRLGRPAAPTPAGHQSRAAISSSASASANP